MAKHYHLGGTSGVSGTASETSSGPKSTKISTTKPPSKPTGAPERSSTDAQPSRTINPADCPNGGVRQNTAYYPTPSSVTTFSCGAASNIGLATWMPATWCACKNPNNQYPTMSGDYPCGCTTPPATTISPGPVKPTTVGPLTDCSLVQ